MTLHPEEILSWHPAPAFQIFRKQGLWALGDVFVCPNSRGKKAQIPGTLTGVSFSRSRARVHRQSALGQSHIFLICKREVHLPQACCKDFGKAPVEAWHRACHRAGRAGVQATCLDYYFLSKSHNTQQLFSGSSALPHPQTYTQLSSPPGAQHPLLCYPN